MGVPDIEEFKRYLKIDKHALDQELEEQPMLFFQISEAFVQAGAERDMLKEQLATVDAKLDNAARDTYNKAEEKYTEAMIKNHVQTDKKHVGAFKLWLEAKKQADLLQVLKEAFQSRGYMIRDLCSLYSDNYFSEASVKGTPKTDRTSYSVGRQRIAEARGRRE
jgi:hypothetical protein